MSVLRVTLHERTYANPKYHRWLLDAFDQRIVGDYDVSSGLDAEMVSEMIDEAREFLQAARTYLMS